LYLIVLEGFFRQNPVHRHLHCWLKATPDLQPAPVHSLLPHKPDGLFNHIINIIRLSGPFHGLVSFPYLQGRITGLFSCRPLQHALCQHLVQYNPTAPLQSPWIYIRIIVPGGPGQSRQHYALGQTQILYILVEVYSGGCLDPVCPFPQVDSV